MINGTINEFARNQEQEITRLAQRRVPQKWTRRINLNPPGTSPTCGNGTNVKPLVISSYSAITFAVGWKPVDEKEAKGDCGNGAERLESARHFFISE